MGFWGLKAQAVLLNPFIYRELRSACETLDPIPAWSKRRLQNLHHNKSQFFDILFEIRDLLIARGR